MRGGPSPHGDAERIDVSARARIVFPASASGCAFDVFLDEPNHEDPGFCRRCGVALSSLSPAGSNWYGLYCPFPDEEPVLNHLASTGREHRLRNGNLVFPIHDLPQDMVDFSSASLLYFGLSLFLVCTAHALRDVPCPPKVRFGADPWPWFAGLDDFHIRAMLSRDHPGCIVHTRAAMDRAAVVATFRCAFLDQ